MSEWLGIEEDELEDVPGDDALPGAAIPEDDYNLPTEAERFRGLRPEDPMAQPAIPAPWKLNDPKRAYSPNQFDSLVRNVLTSVAEKADNPSIASDDAIELLKMTAGNETRLGGYMKPPGSSRQRGIFQITDPTLGDLVKKIQKSPKLEAAIRDVTGVEQITPEEVDRNVPLGVILARLKYMTDPSALPPKSNPQAMAQTYKRVYNTYHPKAKANVNTVLRIYNQLYGSL